MNNNMPNAQFGEFGQQGNNAQQKNIEVYAQSLAQAHRVALNNTASPQAMTQGSPMNQGLDGQEIMFAAAPGQPRPGMPPQQPGGTPQQGSHALQDYQMQLMLLEQQNKKRLLMARQEQDNMSGPHQQGQGQFPPVMSPSGTRPGPSPNPADMKGRTPKLGQQGLPGSPMPEGVMQQQRGSPAPNMNFPDPNNLPPGMPPQFYPQMPNNPMMRPPSSHPGANFNGQPQMSQQQMDAMRSGQMNGQWRGGPPQPGMPQQMMQGGPMAGGPQQRGPGQMPPPPAPANEQRPEASPAMSNQAPPTPNQANKAAPKKKGTKDNKVKLIALCPRATLILILEARTKEGAERRYNSSGLRRRRSSHTNTVYADYTDAHKVLQPEWPASAGPSADTTSDSATAAHGKRRSVRRPRGLELFRPRPQLRRRRPGARELRLRLLPTYW